MVIAAAGNALYLLAVLACPVSMALMMLFMGRGMMGGKKSSDAGDGGSEPDLETLKAEQARLAARIAELDREDTPSQPTQESGTRERETLQMGV